MGWFSKQETRKQAIEQKVLATYKELVEASVSELDRMDSEELGKILDECGKSPAQLEKDRIRHARETSLREQEAELEEFFSHRENNRPQIVVSQAIEARDNEIAAVREKHAKSIADAQAHERNCRSKMKLRDEIRRKLMDKEFEPNIQEQRDEIKNRERGLVSRKNELEQEETSLLDQIQKIGVTARMPESYADGKLPHDVELRIAAVEHPLREKLATVQSERKELESQIQESRRKRAELTAAPMA